MDLLLLRECSACGLLQRMPRLGDGEEAKCGRCRNVLRRSEARLLPLSLICAALASALFVLALSLPLFTMRAAGRSVLSTLLSGPSELDDLGMPVLAIIVFVVLAVAPAVKLILHMAVLLGLRIAPEHPILPWLFGFRARLSEWAMLDVYLLGAFVAYTRVGALATVEVGTALFAVFGAMVAGVAADASLDVEAVWDRMDARDLEYEEETRLTGKLIGCHTCQLVSRAEEGEKCPRCRHVMHSRKPNGKSRTAALLVTGAILYLPANAFPVMSVERLGKGGFHTIWSGVVSLAEARLWPLAILILIASIIVPVFKVVGLTVMLLMTHRRSKRWLRARARVSRVIQVIGRWSMIDIFMLTTLVGVVRLGALASVLPGDGAFAFCGVVIFTMLASENFDPRTMWDAAGLNDRSAIFPMNDPSLNATGEAMSNDAIAAS